MKSWAKLLFVLSFIGGKGKHVSFFGLWLWLAISTSAIAKPVLDVANPLGFFTTVADKMLRNTFSFGVTSIPVYSGGIFVYTPSVQRLLQLSANIYEASTTNFYPTIFRPIFEHDNLGNVFIIGYTNLSSGSGLNTVSGAGDLQLALPYDIDYLLSFPANTPITDANGFVNVYGVPWIIGAKKGFPNFNEFSMQDVMKVARKLQVTRPDTNSLPNATNQMYVFSVTNSLGVEFWNSYTNSYSNQVQVVVNDNLTMQLAFTNGTVLLADSFPLTRSVLFDSQMSFNVWPSNAFLVPFATNFTILPDSAYSFPFTQFYNVAGNPNPTFQATAPAFAPLPQILLEVTNHLQAFILDNNHVIDYVHFSGPGTSRNLTSEFQNTNTTVAGGGTAPYYTNLVWSTVTDYNGIPYGIDTQIGISDGSIPLNNTFWKDLNVKAEIDGFRHFLNPANAPLYGTQNNFLFATNLAVVVPYIPTASTYDYTTYQANDPLVHYLKSDLTYLGYDPDANSGVQTGVHPMPMNSAGLNLLPDLGRVNAHYQPWGKNPPTGETGISLATYDLNAFNLAFKDPLMTRSDSWDFPNGTGLPLTSFGQVHRGTPWQTVYLKASDILSELNPVNPILGNVGTNTWVIWTGNSNINDAVLTAPINDRQLVGWLVPLMDTNAPEQLLSANDSSLADWSALFGGMVVLTNSTAFPQFQPVTYGLLTIDPAGPAGNNSVVGELVTAINTMRAQFRNADGSVGTFENIGDVLSSPQLTEQSPFLNISNTTLSGQQLEYGISDEAYEAIPAQLLPLLRPDSVGTLIQINGKWNIQFSGSDGFAYALQSSTDLIHWNFVSTNCPVQGHYSVPISSVSNSQEQFYRSLLLH
jgi:hypothetical protein